MRGPIDEVPELRWSTVRRARERDKLGRDTTVYDYIARLGKKRGALVEYLVEAGGSATVAELMEGFAGKRTRSRDFKSRTLTPLTDPAVIQIEGDVVTLTQDWLAAVEQHRELAGEPEAERQQAVRVFLDRVAFKNRDNLPEPEPVPEPPKVDDLRKPWPQHPEPCDCRECSSRWGRVIGSHHVDCSCKECYYGRRNGQPPLAPKWIEVVDDLPAEDWREHTLDCECQECMYVMPSYALPCRDSAIKEGR